MPVAAISALLIAAVPAAVLMGVWTVVTVARILWPEAESLPVEAMLSRHERARRRGEAVPARARDIVEDVRQRARRTALPQTTVVVRGSDPEAVNARARLAADLWLRRN